MLAEHEECSVKDGVDTNVSSCCFTYVIHNAIANKLQGGHAQINPPTSMQLKTKAVVAIIPVAMQWLVALLFAAEEGHVDIVYELLSVGANPNSFFCVSHHS